MTPDVFAQEAHALIVEAEYLCRGAAEWQVAEYPYMGAPWRAEWFLRTLQAHPATRARRER